jgi:hypothetical protein
MNRKLTGILPFLVLPFLAACAPTPWLELVPKVGGPSHPSSSARPAKQQLMMSVVKQVTSKQEERNVVVAQDGTWCVVSAERFRRIQVGDVVPCAWQT